MNKRGITTLMALSLVVVFIFVAGVYIYSTYFSPPIGEQDCGARVGWKIMMIDNKEDICYDQKTKLIRFTVENGLLQSINGVYAKINAEKAQKAILLPDAKTGKAGAVVGDIAFDPDTDGKLLNIQLLPVIVAGKKEAACSDEILEKRQLEPCKFYFY